MDPLRPPPSASLTPRRRALGILLALGAGALGCGPDPAPPPPEPVLTSAPSAGAEAPPSGPIDESEAVTIAIQLASAEGYSIEEYSEIVAHESEDASAWIVQMRRPRLLRFVEVSVPKQRGAEATLDIRTSGYF